MHDERIPILLIDDDEDCFIITRDLLAEIPHAKFALDWEPTYDGGLARIAQQAHRVYLVDFRLGARNGLELLREAIVGGCRSPIILLTGQGDDEIDEEAIRPGAADYLVKDQLTPTDLYRAIRHAGERAQTLQAMARLAAVLDASTDFVGMADRELRPIYLNCAAKRMCGVEADSAVPHAHVADFYPERIRELILNEAFPAALERGSWSGETVLLTLDGTEIPLSQLVIAHKTPAGEVEYFSTVARDISERKRAETQLRDTTAQLEALFRAFPDLFFIVNRDGTIVDYKGGSEADLYLPAARFLGQRIEDILPPAVGEHFTAVCARVFATRQLASVEYSLPLAAGEQYFEARVVPLGEDRLVVLARNISKRKQAELAQIRLVTAVEQSTEVVMITDPQGTIQYVNPAFVQITGYTPQEAIGQTPRLLKSGKHDATFFADLWATLLAGRTWRGHLTNKKKDGHLFVVEANISPVRDATGKVINYVAISRDISYERQIEEQLRQIQKMEAVGRLAGGVAHDFNNILTVITGYCALLLQRINAADSGRHEVEEIMKSSERATALTRQLLAFSRKQLLNPQELNLNDIASGIEKMLRRLIGENVELHTRLYPQPCFVKADAGQVEQVIVNLAVNARDAMPLGGKLFIETSRVTLEHINKYDHKDFTPGDYIRLAVTDTGVGMTEQIKAHLFEPFFTTKGLGHGTGLGLATIYGIIKQSGGHILVYSEPGHGSCFKIYLPAIPTPALPAVMVPTATSLQTGSETILLVEDEDALRELAACVLRESGFTVLAASNGAEGLQVARTLQDRAIDLILTDVIMPQMGGKEMIHQMRDLLPHAKVLFVSGYTDDALTQHGVLEPGIAFLEKPFSPARLTFKVREVLDNAQPHGANVSTSRCR